jgi:hypothetical protein
MKTGRRDFLPERVVSVAVWGVVVATLVATLSWLPLDDWSSQNSYFLLPAFGDDVQPLRFFSCFVFAQNNHGLLDGVSAACSSRAPPA